MRELKKIGVLFAFALTVALASVNVQTVYAAENVTTADDVVVDTTVDDTVSDDTVADDTTADNTVSDDTVADDTTADNTVTDDTAVTNDTVADDTTAVSTYAETTEDADELEDAYAYTTWNDDNCHDDESKKNMVELKGEDGDELETIFKINFTGAYVDPAVGFSHDEDLTQYCTNLPTGLDLTKYSANTGASYMRVKLAGNATAGNYNVTVTIPNEKLKAAKGYQVSEDGLAVTFYLTVDGHMIPVTVPTTHEHSYDWQTLKQVNDSQDGLEAYMCSCGDIEYTRVVSAYGLWLDSVEEQILSAEENAVVEIKTEIWNTYSKDIMNALNARADVTLVTTFGKGEEAVTFTIPAGACAIIEEEATALAGSVEEAAGTAPVEEETEWFGYQFLTAAYNN